MRFSVSSVRDFFEYGPFVSQAVIERDKRRRAERLRRAKQRRLEVAKAEEEVSTFDRYVRGKTGQDVLRERKILQRRKLAAVAESGLSRTEIYLLGITGEDVLRNREERVRRIKAEQRRKFEQEYADEIRAQKTWITNRFPWYKYDDDLARAIDRKVRNEVWEENRDDFDFIDYDGR